MIDNETIRKLREMNLSEFIDIIEVQQKDPSCITIPFDERMKRIIDYVYHQKHNKRIVNLQKMAKFRFPKADVIDIDYNDRGFERNVIEELTTCGYIDIFENIVLEGYTGSGKTFLSCALGKQACTHMKKVRYIRLPDLLVLYEDKRYLSSAQVEKLLNKFSRYDLLIIDEWLMEDLTKEEIHFIFELIERRYDSHSTIFCTQYRKEDWLERLGSDVHAEAITDRIIHKAIWIKMGSRNMRENTPNR